VKLSEAVAGAGWQQLLPSHRADGDDQPAGAPRCVGGLPLGDGLVLAVVEDDRGRTYPVPLAPHDDGVRRAVPADGAAEALVRLLADGDAERDGFTITTWHHQAAAGERAITVDQTNESVVVGDRAVVKWTFLADEGPHPAPSLLSLLDAAGFTGTPTPWGAVAWHGRLLAVVVDYVPGAVDGWTWAVDDIRTLDHDRAAASGREVGELVARFHRALAATSRPATGAERAAWKRGALRDLDRALEVSTSPVLRAHAGNARSLLGAEHRDDVLVQRVHGDLHVGQVLRSADRTVLTDFDGNPVVPAAERVREQPVALDVAGMAQSFTHAGLVVRKHYPELDPVRVEASAALARREFLAGYGDVDSHLLRAFSVRQVCREFTYAATHLPRWTYVPEAALPMLLPREYA
jgi:maltokinase